MMRRNSSEDEYGNLDQKKSAWQIMEFLLTNILSGRVSPRVLQQNQEFGDSQYKEFHEKNAISLSRYDAVRWKYECCDRGAADRRYSEHDIRCRSHRRCCEVRFCHWLGLLH